MRHGSSFDKYAKKIKVYNSIKLKRFDKLSFLNKISCFFNIKNILIKSGFDVNFKI